MHPRRDGLRRINQLKRTDPNLPQHLPRRIPTRHNHPTYADRRSNPPHNRRQRSRHLREVPGIQLIRMHDDPIDPRHERANHPLHHTLRERTSRLTHRAVWRPSSRLSRHTVSECGGLLTRQAVRRRSSRLTGHTVGGRGGRLSCRAVW